MGLFCLHLCTSGYCHLLSCLVNHEKHLRWRLKDFREILLKPLTCYRLLEYSKSLFQTHVQKTSYYWFDHKMVSVFIKWSLVFFIFKADIDSLQRLCDRVIKLLQQLQWWPISCNEICHKLVTIDSAMFARTNFLLIFANMLPCEFKILIQNGNIYF